MKCRKCGKCCHLVYIFLDPIMAEEQLTMLGWKGFKIHRLENITILEFDAPCKFLTSDNLCEIYDHKPRYCTDYPTAGMWGYPEGCGYKEEKDDK